MDMSPGNSAAVQEQINNAASPASDQTELEAPEPDSPASLPAVAPLPPGSPATFAPPASPPGSVGSPGTVYSPVLTQHVSPFTPPQVGGPSTANQLETLVNDAKTQTGEGQRPFIDYLYNVYFVRARTNVYLRRNVPVPYILARSMMRITEVSNKSIFKVQPEFLFYVVQAVHGENLDQINYVKENTDARKVVQELMAVGQVPESAFDPIIVGAPQGNATQNAILAAAPAAAPPPTPAPPQVTEVDEITAAGYPASKRRKTTTKYAPGYKSKKQRKQERSQKKQKK
jgi:hypothetical protein